MTTIKTIKIIDAHAHLWLQQETVVNGLAIHQHPWNRSRSEFLGNPDVQMLPPFMIDGKNSAEVFLSNMDYAQVSAAVVTQEFIDGLQNEYLEEVSQRYPDRFFCFTIGRSTDEDMSPRMAASIFPAMRSSINASGSSYMATSYCFMASTLLSTLPASVPRPIPTRAFGRSLERRASVLNIVPPTDSL